ncbi:DNA polymerase III subunit beta [Novosphingobium sp. ST904]|uniref:DNA polymerase III subunit beta n=1 Tax=Novosphingobium sp. ST904 TaxID=1684385 RepID=UPI0006C8E33F|nr:DNA polymerase III subunit beta [Novosphingobium sp. ST904]KPH67532.1 hypothetical protein ADT71_02200 [Novosphingobium sp. ST904]TCM30035.1 DNA polymerase-3 subunit beta [Novosphingobium sp. ST904]
MIEVNRKLFSRAVELAAAATSRYATIPIISTLKVTANGKLRLEGTDLDNHAVAELPYDGKPGEFTLPQPRLLRTAVNQAGGDTVKLDANEENKLRLRAGRLDSNLITQSAEDFPAHPRISFEDFSATLGSGELKQIRRVMAAMSEEETRYYLNGVCVSHVADWTYRFAATNGHVLLVVDVALPDAAGVMPDMTIIPRGWLNTIMARFAKTKSGARLTYGRQGIPNTAGPDLPLQPGGDRIALRADLDGIDYAVTGKLIDGKYPDYSKVIPANQEYAARPRRADLVQAVHTVSAICFGKHRAVKLSFPAGKLRVELNSPDLGDSAFEIDAQHNVPEGFGHIGLNTDYLLRILNSLHGEEVVLGIAQVSMAPVTFADPADTAFKAVLMPTRI